MVISLVDALVCRLRRVRPSSAGAVAVLRGNGGTASEVYPLAAAALALAVAVAGGISVVRRGRLSGVVIEGRPI